MKNKIERFYKRLITNAETQMQINNTRIVYFTESGSVLEKETEQCRYYVTGGVVYDNTEKVSTKMSKYSVNLGMLY
jgi:hypothetical protein